MTRPHLTSTFVAALAILATALHPTTYAQTAGATRLKACALLPKEEVKKHLPWNTVLDQMPPEEEAIGAAGASCNYPSVFIQVFPVARKATGLPSTQPGWQPLAGVGEEAFFRSNRGEYAELYVRTSRYTLTLQANATPSVEAVKPGTISLANALLAKLR